MKKCLFIIFICISGQLFSQAKQDINEIINIVIKDCDSIYYSKKFANSNLLEELRNEYIKIQLLDSNVNLISEDTFVFEHISFNFDTNEKNLKKFNNRKIKNIKNCKCNNKNINIYKISYPIISPDNMHAIIYYSEFCGPLCGSGGLIILEKTNNKWVIKDVIIKWIS